MPFDSLPEPPMTEVLPEAASINDTWCEQLAVDSGGCVDVPGETDSSVQPADKAEKTDEATTMEILPRLSVVDLHELQKQDSLMGCDCGMAS